ncbi:MULTISPECIES: LysR family transcriptional regulator [unclassified Achromobacter]|uniref:LysR family transcriptional regulator n=1 Tax=unclassified Achromobacter TaxID=2626865 RepID=UPI000B51E153|nr:MULTISPECIES: LysR family transcriptional regulator [unclassified Achromobacter]OWT80273.1 LysR family transcriptional regulator [Achromobacter sp. HZ34]OWT82156.1 LysR family transcriptional regulator [Achromobacter sp. HZ28]
MLPDLDSIALFVKAAELRSLTRAAAASSMGLAAASRRISLLEHCLKCSLFDRSHKGVELTPAGLTLLHHAKQLLIQLNQMQADLDEHGSGRRSALRVQANTSAMAQYVPADLAIFNTQHPDVTLTVKERWSDQIVQALLLGEADVGIINPGGSLEGLECQPYRKDHLCVVMPRDHALTRHKEVWFEQVLDYPLVGLEYGASLMDLLAAQAGLAQKSLKLRVQMQGFEAVCRMIEAGMGIGVLPQLAAEAYLPAMHLEIRLLNDKWASRQMLVCTARGREKSDSLIKLVRALSHAVPPGE